jgi:hypothetical protein
MKKKKMRSNKNAVELRHVKRKPRAESNMSTKAHSGLPSCGDPVSR